MAAIKKNKKSAVKKKKTAKVSTRKNKKAGAKKSVKKLKKPLAKQKKKIVKKTIRKKPAVKKQPLKAKKITKPVIKKPAQVKEVQKQRTTEKSVVAKKAAKIIPQLPALKPIHVSNFPKLKVKRILISQPRPESEKSPYLELARKYNLKIDFRHFISIEGVAAKEFRQQRINILDHNAVILTSRIAIDHYFRMANEMRLNIPETMKYFCLSESIAYYLQKYVQYRKRKIFFGHQTIADLVDVIKKHREEKFLLPVSDVHREQIADFLDELQVKYTKATFYRTVAADLSDMKGVLDYDMLVFFTPAGIRSLRKNFPTFRQGNTRIAVFGHNTALTVQEYGYRLDIHAPTPQAPSMIMAMEHYIREANKR